MTSNFAYQATTANGLSISGSILADSMDHARAQLGTLQLSIIDLQPQTERPAGGRGMSAMDFIAFNQQLSHLTASGMPVEQGLRLIAEDLHHGRLKQTIAELSRELEGGQSLSQTLSRHATQFPPLYAQLVNAGVQTSNLPAMLLNIGHHAEMVQRLRQQLWRALAYPLAMFIAATALVTFVSWVVLPKLWTVIYDFRVEVPTATKFFMALGKVAAPVMIALAVIIVLLMILAPVLGNTFIGRWFTDTAVLRLPLIGPALKFNLLARWCDAMRIAVDGSLDLPRALQLAGSVIASPRVAGDTQKLFDAVSSGTALQSVTPLSILPATIPATIAFASKNGQLSPALATLAHLYQQQAELRIAAIPTVLTPVIILPVALMIGGAILALMLPMISLIQSVASPSKK